MKSLLPVALLAAAALAGCASTSPATTQTGPPPALLDRVAQVPPLQYNATAGAQWWSDFAQTYQKRDVFTASNLAARDHIAASLRSAGFDVQVLQYPAGVHLARPVDAPAPAGPLVTNVVVAKRLGAALPTHAIALGGHYDTQTGTLQGAYDNGSGTAAVVDTCGALAKVETRRTVLCLVFDAEEVGAVGSADFQADLRRDNLTIDAYLGFDMVGLNWPGIDTGAPGMEKWKLYAWTGAEYADSVFPLVNGTLHQVLGYPLSGSEAFPFNDRNSDEATFAAAHIPTVRFAGGRTAGLYPQYHMPGDTVEFVDQFAGGRAHFEQGLAAIVRTAYQVALELDQTSLDELKAAYH